MADPACVHTKAQAVSKGDEGRLTKINAL